MGEGILKDSVPEAHTDYIISIISEEYGSIISILIVAIFLYIAFRIIKNCILKHDEFLKLSFMWSCFTFYFSNFYSRRSEYKFNSNHWHDFALFKLWRLIFNW